MHPTDGAVLKGMSMSMNEPFIKAHWTVRRTEFLEKIKRLLSAPYSLENTVATLDLLENISDSLAHTRFPARQQRYAKLAN